MSINSPLVIWFTGLSGSGKTTLSTSLNQELQKMNYSFKLLDGDVLRSGVNSDLTYSIRDRKENVRRLAEINLLFLDFGISVINSFIMPTEEIRDLFRKIISKYNSFEIFLSTPLPVCIARDPKGHYKRTLAGEIPDFSGFGSPFEPSENANLILNTEAKTIIECTETILKSCIKAFTTV